MGYRVYGMGCALWLSLKNVLRAYSRRNDANKPVNPITKKFTEARIVANAMINNKSVAIPPK